MEPGFALTSRDRLCIEVGLSRSRCITDCRIRQWQSDLPDWDATEQRT